MVRLTLTFVATLLAATGLVAGAGIPRADSEPVLEPIPAGAADGFYFGYLKEDGSTEWKYAGADAASVNPTNATVGFRPSTPSTSSESSELVKRDSVNCNGYGVNADSANVAQGELADMCGNGYFFSSRSVAKVSGDAVAYGCNYGNGQTCHSGDLWSFFGQINSKCGFTHGASAGAGWYAATGWKAAYGRASAGTGFC
ncbi:hypothetical protein C8Q74DRAFT_398872 [Fomes fomentarius]|nr:hypothetical protein C8Q74DRAFT_398872 [Fomes fomentarius]